MNKIKLLFSVSLLLIASVVFGQTEKSVSSMKAGTKLTESDIAFLSLVANGTPDATRGAAAQTATINGVTYSVGQVLTSSQAKSINKAVKAFQKSYKAPEGSRGAGWCYYWYYYCDWYGYCWYYKYWYICY